MKKNKDVLLITDIVDRPIKVVYRVDDNGTSCSECVLRHICDDYDCSLPLGYIFVFSNHERAR